MENDKQFASDIATMNSVTQSTTGFDPIASLFDGLKGLFSGQMIAIVGGIIGFILLLAIVAKMMKMRSGAGAITSMGTSAMQNPQLMQMAMTAATGNRMGPMMGQMGQMGQMMGQMGPMGQMMGPMGQMMGQMGPRM